MTESEGQAILRRLDDMERQRDKAREENAREMSAMRNDISEIKNVQASQATVLAGITAKDAMVDGAWTAFKNLVTYVGPLVTLIVLLWKG